MPRIGSLFLSATARDCFSYRALLKHELGGIKPGAVIDLQEAWGQGGASVVDSCRRRVRDSHAYLGLFAHRYGWVPNDHTQSITQLEFGWAVERWLGESAPPIFVMLPKKPSAAHRELAALARQTFDEDGASAAERAKSRRLQQQFLADVSRWAEGRIVAYFTDRDDLRFKAVRCVQDWELASYEAAPSRAQAVAGTVPDAMLGRIGREQQLDALARARRSLLRQTQEPAACFVVHGAAGHGQWEFAACLADDEVWRPGVSPLQCRLVRADAAGDACEGTAIAQKAAAALDQPVVGATASQTVSRLAELVLKRLRNQSLVLVQPHLGLRADRLNRFVETLWRPLREQLAAGWHGVPPPHRLFWIVVDDAPLAAPPAERGLQALPALGPLTVDDVSAWLEARVQSGELALSNAEMARIAAFALTNGNLPPQVYSRLRMDGFWSR
jgi:hypothetical protein